MISQCFKKVLHIHATIKIEQKSKKYKVMVSLSTLYFINTIQPPLIYIAPSSSGETRFLLKLINLQ